MVGNMRYQSYIAAGMAAFLLGAAVGEAAELDFGRFHQRALMQAIVEGDVGYLSSGPALTIVGRKLFGIEVYHRVADVCSSPTASKEAELRQLKLAYLSEVLAAPSNGEVRRADLLAAVDNAIDDADLLVDTVGCQSAVTRRIIAEVGS